MSKVKKPRLDNSKKSSTEIDETLTLDDFQGIFNFLDVDDMKAARIVNHQWKSFIQNQFEKKSAFVPSRNSILNEKCPPWSIFKNSTNLNIKNLRFTKNPKNHEKFWKEIGKEVEWIDFTSVGYSKTFPKDFLLNFPKLKEIKLLWHHLVLFKIPLTLEKIEVISVPEFISPANLKIFNEIANVPGLKEIITSKVSKTRNRQIPFIKLLPNFDVERFKSFNILQSKELGIEDIEALKLSDLSAISRILEAPNLKELKLNVDFNGCFFSHEELSKNSKIEKVKITFERDSECCPICTENLTKTCPAIIEWNITDSSEIPNCENLLEKSIKNLVLKMTWKPFDFVFQFLDLVELRLHGHFVFTFNLDQTFNGGKMVKLKKLTLNSELEQNISDERLIKILENCPFVEEVRFENLTDQQILMIEEKWPQLKILQFMYSPEINSAKKIIEGLTGNFKVLQVLDRRVEGTKVPDRDYCQLFEKIPTLRTSFAMNYDHFCQFKYLNSDF